MKVKPTAAEERPLNTIQRKMLDKIYTGEMDTKISEYRQLRQGKRDALVKSITTKENTKHKVILKKATALAKQLGKLDKKLKESGFTLGQNLSGIDFTIRYAGYGYPTYNSQKAKNSQIAKFDEETSISQAKLNDLKNEIRADIYGLPLTYNQIRAELDKKIKTLKLA